MDGDAVAPPADVGMEAARSLRPIFAESISSAEVIARPPASPSIALLCCVRYCLSRPCQQQLHLPIRPS